MAWESIDLPGAEIALDREWLPTPAADALFQALREQVPWEMHRIRLFGREADSPRLSCWIGDPGASYAYSGRRHEPHPWPEALGPVRERVSAACDVAFNSVLANLYRDGRDAMGWHRDDEPELGPRPVIASLSLGASRRFLVKPVAATRAAADAARGTHGAASPRVRTRATAIELRHGSLLVMRGETQRRYRHALPRTAITKGPRINLTFRRVLPGASGTARIPP